MKEDYYLSETLTSIQFNSNNECASVAADAAFTQRRMHTQRRTVSAAGNMCKMKTQIQTEEAGRIVKL